jgi:hypothetical protein
VVELEALDGGDNGLDVAVWNRALDAEAFGGGGNGVAGAVVLEELAQAEDKVVGPDAALKSRGNFCFFMVVRVEGLVVL